jgi:hypothetical protein
VAAKSVKFPAFSLMIRELMPENGSQQTESSTNDTDGRRRDCRRRQSIYLWIKKKVERLVDALKLSRASGIPIEKFAGGIIDAEQSKEAK